MMALGRASGSVGAALAIVLAALLAPAMQGCPSNESPSTPASTESVEIGSTVALTGDLSGTGKDNADAENLAVEEINAAGGVLGRPLKLALEDDRTTVDGARAAYSTLVARGVPAIVGPSSSSQVAAVADLIATARILTIGRTATSPNLTSLADDDFFFRVAPSDVFQGKLLARLVRETGIQRLCIVHREDAYGTRLADVVSETLGTTVSVTRSSYNPTSKDLSGVLRKCDPLLCSQNDGGAADAGAPCSEDTKVALLMATFVTDGAAVLRSAGPWSAKKQHFFFTDGSRDAELVRLGLPLDVLEGARGTLPSGPDTTSADGAVLLRYQNAFRSRYGAPAPAFAETAYEAIYVAATAIELAGTASGPAARDAMRRLSNPDGVKVSAGDWRGIRETIAAGQPIDYRGVTGGADFDANGDLSPPYYYRVWRIADGASVTDRIEKVTE
jgi:branched-chain amino acid transport system substrate-binding protein